MANTTCEKCYGYGYLPDSITGSVDSVPDRGSVLCNVCVGSGLDEMELENPEYTISPATDNITFAAIILNHAITNPGVTTEDDLLRVVELVTRDLSPQTLEVCILTLRKRKEINIAAQLNPFEADSLSEISDKESDLGTADVQSEENDQEIYIDTIVPSSHEGTHTTETEPEFELDEEGYIQINVIPPVRPPKDKKINTQKNNKLPMVDIDLVLPPEPLPLPQVVEVDVPTTEVEAKVEDPVLPPVSPKSTQPTSFPECLLQGFIELLKQFKCDASYIHENGEDIFYIDDFPVILSREEIIKLETITKTNVVIIANIAYNNLSHTFIVCDINISDTTA